MSSNIKKIAYDFIIKNKINNFKISFDKLIHIIESNGWNINSFQDSYELIEKLHIPNTALNKKGLTCILTTKGDMEYFIFYKSNLTYEEKIFIILHEIGHILLNHFDYYAVPIIDSACINDDTTTKAQEKEADLFVYEVLAPSSILNYLNITTAEEINSISYLDFENSLSYVAELHKSKINDNETMVLDKLLIKNYKEYIKTSNKLKFKHMLKKTPILKKTTYILTIVFVTVSSITLSSLYFKQKQSSTINTSLFNNIKFIDIKPIETTTEEITEINTEIVTEVQTEYSNIENSDMIVVINNSTKKYHKTTCRYAKSQNTRKITLSEAKEQNGIACLVCNPE